MLPQGQGHRQATAKGQIHDATVAARVRKLLIWTNSGISRLLCQEIFSSWQHEVLIVGKDFASVNQL